MTDTQKILDANGLTLSDVGALIDKDKSTVSKILSGNYPNAARLQREIAEALKSAGYDVPEDDGFEISLDVNAFMPTMSVQKVFALYQSLLAPDSTLNSSIGCVTGSAGRGKTYSAKRFCADNPDAVYVLYVDGFSQTATARSNAVLWRLNRRLPRAAVWSLLTKPTKCRCRFWRCCGLSTRRQGSRWRWSARIGSTPKWRQSQDSVPESGTLTSASTLSTQAK